MVITADGDSAAEDTVGTEFRGSPIFVRSAFKGVERPLWVLESGRLANVDVTRNPTNSISVHRCISDFQRYAAGGSTDCTIRCRPSLVETWRCSYPTRRHVEKEPPIRQA
jgi:hypothetical protein